MRLQSGHERVLRQRDRYRQIPAVWRVIFACVFSGLSVWLSLVMGSGLGAGVFAFLFPVTVVSVWIGGMLSGVIATVLLALGAGFYHLPPAEAWNIHRTADILGLAVFAVSGVMVSWLVDSRQRTTNFKRAVLASIGDAVITTDGRTTVRFMNREAERLTGWDIAEAQAKSLVDVVRIEDSEGTEIDLQRMVAQAIGQHEVLTLPPHSFVRARNGERRAVSDSLAPIQTPHGDVSGIVILLRDDTERRRIEQAALEAERRYREIFENAVVGMFQSTPEGRYLRVNRAMAAMHGYSSPEEMVSAISEVRREKYVDAMQGETLWQMLNEHQEVRAFSRDMVRRDGTRLSTVMNARLVRDAHGVPLYYEGMEEDVTERRRLQSHLEHAQRMQAVGSLAGGIAHDFNNILGVITGYCDLAEQKVARDAPIANFVAHIKAAAAKGAGLTRQLLAFGKQQESHPVVLTLQGVVRDMFPMLQRLVGEEIAIRVKVGPAAGLVHADPVQIEQVVMNLAANARDAMSSRGRIDIEVANATLDTNYAGTHPPATPGEYVMLSFSDNGQGIDEAILPRIFEPFFTTKAPDKGTGLGLATVYGIVQQCKGHIWVYSEVGRGTTFKIYLPRTYEEAQSLPASSPLAAAEGGTETILLVEDDAAMLDVVAGMLESGGYRALRAQDGETATRILADRAGQVDLLLTDVRMKDLSGPELYAQLSQAKPGLRVLYMSGFAGDQLRGAGPVELLQKPFTKNDLWKKIRQMLGSPQT